MVCFTFTVCAVMVFLILMFRNNDGVVHILKSGSCDFYTTDDNSSVKLSIFKFTKLAKTQFHL